MKDRSIAILWTIAFGLRIQLVVGEVIVRVYWQCLLLQRPKVAG